jgi:hypothetical protein
MKGMVITQPNGSLGAQLAHLAKLQGELALAETRSLSYRPPWRSR